MELTLFQKKEKFDYKAENSVHTFIKHNKYTMIMLYWILICRNSQLHQNQMELEESRSWEDNFSAERTAVSTVYYSSRAHGSCMREAWIT